ncbi:MAG TPA: ferritin-like domain-containing protein [Acidobacteriaceae bacterium]|nr:ferritin-like domain-containing protein [Acidobacteriaceae bacterium]
MATPRAVNAVQIHHDVAARERGGAQQLQIDPETKKLVKRSDMTWHDHLIMLLNLGAAIEHALMVQYLYAAYSLGNTHVPEEFRPNVQQWQETILSVAREEMGHLLTVQNVLTLMGAGVNLNRQNFPWDIAYYPFPFTLEPLSLDSLARYVYAEMPLDELHSDNAVIVEIRRRATGGKSPDEIHSVGLIYSEIIELIGDEKRIQDSSFHENTYSHQASWDDWGRRYGPELRPLDAEGGLLEPTPGVIGGAAEAKTDPHSRAILLIEQVASRTEAIAALYAVSVQGEGPHGAGEGEMSHFQRFLHIYKDWKAIVKDDWLPTRNVVKNPTTLKLPGASAPEGYISWKYTQHWADLFNTRYRLLLNLISHTFREALATPAGQPSLRAVLMHRIFGEMYNLKAIAGILVQLPVKDLAGAEADRDTLYAGPPFEMPFSLTLPPDDADAFGMHLDVLGSSDKLCYEILYCRRSKEAPPFISERPEDEAYIRTLLDIDSQTRDSMRATIAGLKKGGR